MRELASARDPALAVDNKPGEQGNLGIGIDQRLQLDQCLVAADLGLQQ